MASNPRKPLLALGLDGGDLDFIRQNLAHLPTLGAALADVKLYRPEPPQALSGSVWPTF